MYEDTDQSEQIIRDFKNILDRGNPLEMQVFIENTYPGWLVTVSDAYSADYIFLENNWSVICDKIGVKKGRIITVDRVFFDKKDDVRHHTIMTVSECLTREGYVIRRADEFINCDVCLGVIPSYEIWIFMKSKGLPVPMEWSIRCRGCKEN